MQNETHKQRLFLGACLSLVATSVSFAVIGASMGPLKTQFMLSNLQIGMIGGANLYGFAITQLIFSPLCDTLGMKRLLQLAFVGHLLGALSMIFAGGFGLLYTGALLISMGNGLVEAACNPLVVALYPDNKSVKLNQFHVWFPGGIVIGGVLSFLLDQIGITAWQVKIALILIPTVIYAFLMFRETFPKTEASAAGVSLAQAFRETLQAPVVSVGLLMIGMIIMMLNNMGVLQVGSDVVNWLFLGSLVVSIVMGIMAWMAGRKLEVLMLVMLMAMAITASSELGPGRWVPAVLESGGMHGILVLAWINGLMAILRYNAGAFVHRFSPTGTLLISAVLTVIGLYWLSAAESLVMVLPAATVFALGVCFFWPTMLGFVSERVPKSGAFGLGLMGAVGMAVTGLFTAPQMGAIADKYLHEKLAPTEVIAVVNEAKATFPALIDQAQGPIKEEVRKALSDAEAVEKAYQAAGKLPEGDTAGALREVIAQGGTSDAANKAKAVLNPADNYGGRMAFRAIVPFTALLILVFGFLYWQDRQRGGYKVEKLTPTA
ncbi:MAG: MFS transporter [Rhodothermia bacterium]|nr:MFS transporter [Rhodothermia bacterium]